LTSPTNKATIIDISSSCSFAMTEVEKELQYSHFWQDPDPYLMNLAQITHSSK